MKMTRVRQQDSRSNRSASEVCFTTKTGRVLSSEDRWVLDTGCTTHMTNATTSLGWWNTCAEKVMLADGRTVTARRKGKGQIAGRGLSGECIEIKLKELLYVPELSGSVLSVSRITNEGYTVLFGPTECRIMDGNAVIAVGVKIDGLYFLKQ